MVSTRYTADHLDTPRRVADSTNTIVWNWGSKPFGEDEANGTITLNLRFPGQYFDAETKTHYNINRDYNPVTGRYIQSDPIGLDGGVNTFLYVGGNSLNGMDLEGKNIVLVPEALELGGAALSTAYRWVLRKIARAVAADILADGESEGDDTNRGRIQIQGKGIEFSTSWASKYPPSKSDGRKALARMENQFKIFKKDAYDRLTKCGAFDKAVAYINNAPFYGLSATGGSKSFDCASNQVNQERIDFEIITGSAFVSY